MVLGKCLLKSLQRDLEGKNGLGAYPDKTNSMTVIHFFWGTKVKHLSDDDVERIKAGIYLNLYVIPLSSSFVMGTRCQNMTSIDELPAGERKRQREALRRRMAQPGHFFKINWYD